LRLGRGLIVSGLLALGLALFGVRRSPVTN
jgi:hypothetical protein